MPAPTPETLRALTETLSDVTEYLRENPDPAEALALVEPLLDEYTGLPVQLADTLRALARTVQEHQAIPRTAHVTTSSGRFVRSKSAVACVSETIWKPTSLKVGAELWAVTTHTMKTKPATARQRPSQAGYAACSQPSMPSRRRIQAPAS